MNPTYSTEEVIILIDLCDSESELKKVWDIVYEERKRYCLDDLDTMIICVRLKRAVLFL